jgi:hypothetical protein
METCSHHRFVINGDKLAPNLHWHNRLLLMDSPPPKVFYADLPEQPPKVLYDNIWDTKEDEGVIIGTPKRKTRIAKERHTRKRPRPANPSTERPNDASEFTSSPDTLSILDDSTNFGDTQEDQAGLPETVDIAYASFVDAILSDECSFYQLSQKLFVANGWHPVRNEMSVRVQDIKFISI